MKSKVLLGCPTSFHKEYCLKEYAEVITSLSYDNYDILLADNSPSGDYSEKIKSYGINIIKGQYFESARDRIVASRNLLRQHAIDNNYDYFFSLEQDVIPPKDIIERLLTHNKKVLTGVYFAHNVFKDKKLLIPLVYTSIEDGKGLPSMRPLNDAELLSNRLIKVVSCGLGCVLIHRNILRQIEFRYEENTFDDRWFCIDLYNKKIEIYCDTSIKCKHLILNRPYPWDAIKK